MPTLFDAQSLHSYDPISLQELFNDCYCAMDYGSTEEQAPWGMRCLGGVRLGAAAIYEDAVQGSFRSRRTRRHILQDSVRDFLVLIPTVGSATVLQRSEVRTCKPGSFMILSTSIPYDGCSSATGARGKFSKISARISGTLLQQLIPRIEDLSNVPAQLQPGAGNLMKSLLEIALAEGGALSDSQAQQFGKTLVETVANAIWEAPEYEPLLAKPGLTPYSRIQEMAMDYIARNLANAKLSSKDVAQHCGVSERHLRTAFGSMPFGVSSYIRELRLQHCRSALRNLMLADYSMNKIAESWGFSDPSSFNRIYKMRFGTTPGKERDAAISLAREGRY